MITSVSAKWIAEGLGAINT